MTRLGSFVAFAALQPVYEKLDVAEDLNCLMPTIEDDKDFKELKKQIYELSWVSSPVKPGLEIVPNWVLTSWLGFLCGQAPGVWSLQTMSHYCILAVELWQPHDDNDQSSLLQKNEELTRDMESSSALTAESRATIAKLQHALELAKQVISLTWSSRQCFRPTSSDNMRARETTICRLAK